MLGQERRTPLAAISNAVCVLKHATQGDEGWVTARDVMGRQSQHLGHLF